MRLLRAVRQAVRWLRRPVILCVLGSLLAPALALAAPPSPVLVLNGGQFWALVIGSLTPLLGYVLNHFAPWVSEPIKAAVQVVIPAIATIIYGAVATHTFGWNTATFELIATGIVSALVAHKIIWLPSGISVLLGGGSDAPRPAAKRRHRPAAVSRPPAT